MENPRKEHDTAEVICPREALTRASVFVICIHFVPNRAKLFYDILSIGELNHLSMIKWSSFFCTKTQTWIQGKTIGRFSGRRNRAGAWALRHWERKFRSHSLVRRVNARNFSFVMFGRWHCDPSELFRLPNLRVLLPRWCLSTVSLQIKPFIDFQQPFFLDSALYVSRRFPKERNCI